MSLIPIPPKSKRKRAQLISGKLVFDDALLGDVGFVSEDLWKDIFGGLPPSRTKKAPVVHDGRISHELNDARWLTFGTKRARPFEHSPAGR